MKRTSSRRESHGGRIIVEQLPFISADHHQSQTTYNEGSPKLVLSPLMVCRVSGSTIFVVGKGRHRYKMTASAVSFVGAR